MKSVLYNKGGHVAHIAIKIAEEDSFDAFYVAATVASKNDGVVEALYSDNKWGQRTRILGVERAGLVLEPGTLDDQAELAREVDRLRNGIADYLLWEPRKAGHADAHRTLAKLVADADSEA